MILRDWSNDAVSMPESGELTVEQLRLNSQTLERAVFWLFVSVNDQTGDRELGYQA
jgi:hypothetical protein